MSEMEITFPFERSQLQIKNDQLNQLTTQQALRIQQLEIQNQQLQHTLQQTEMRKNDQLSRSKLLEYRSLLQLDATIAEQYHLEAMNDLLTKNTEIYRYRARELNKQLQSSELQKDDLSATFGQVIATLEEDATQSASQLQMLLQDKIRLQYEVQVRDQMLVTMLKTKGDVRALTNTPHLTRPISPQFQTMHSDAAHNARQDELLQQVIMKQRQQKEQGEGEPFLPASSSLSQHRRSPLKKFATSNNSSRVSTSDTTRTTANATIGLDLIDDGIMPPTTAPSTAVPKHVPPSSSSLSPQSSGQHHQFDNHSRPVTNTLMLLSPSSPFRSAILGATSASPSPSPSSSPDKRQQLNNIRSGFAKEEGEDDHHKDYEVVAPFLPEHYHSLTLKNTLLQRYLQLICHFAHYLATTSAASSTDKTIEIHLHHSTINDDDLNNIISWLRTISPLSISCLNLYENLITTAGLVKLLTWMIAWSTEEWYQRLTSSRPLQIDLRYNKMKIEGEEEEIDACIQLLKDSLPEIIAYIDYDKMKSEKEKKRIMIYLKPVQGDDKEDEEDKGEEEGQQRKLLAVVINVSKQNQSSSLSKKKASNSSKYYTMSAIEPENIDLHTFISSTFNQGKIEAGEDPYLQPSSAFIPSDETILRAKKLKE